MTPELIDQVCDYYGPHNQVIKAIEELSELQKELCKALLLDDLKLTNIPTENIIDELADVEIICTQLRHILSITEQVDARKEFKINRLKERINQ